MQTVTLQEAQSAPVWRRPIFLLFVMAAAMPIAFATWSALLNNFVIEVANFDGADIGLLHSVREIPGFLAVGVIAIIIFVREQVLGLLSLVLLGLATAVTAWFPQMGGILTLTSALLCRLSLLRNGQPIACNCNGFPRRRRRRSWAGSWPWGRPPRWWHLGSLS